MYDPNGLYLYNQYLIYNRGIHPTPEQYHKFVQNFYYYQYPHMYPSYPVYQYQPNQENFIIDVKQPEHQLEPSTKLNKNCNLNMDCKDTGCLLFHHPSLNKK